MPVFPLNILIAAFLFIVLTGWGYLKITKTWIKLDEQGLTIRKGVITEERSTFLYSQIQDIKEAQTLYDAILGVKRLRIVTMTYTSVLATELPLFNVAESDEIKNTIFEKMKTIENLKNKRQEKKLEKPEKILKEAALTLELKNIALGMISSAIAFISIIFVLILFFAIYLLLSFSGFLEWELIKNIGNFSFITLGSIAIIIVLFLLIMVARHIELINFKVSISNNRLEIQYGLFSIKKASFNISKIQDIVITRNIVEKFFNLSNVKAETGGIEKIFSSNKNDQLLNVDTAIPYIKPDKAFWLREFLFSSNDLNQNQDIEPLSKRIPLEQRKPIKRTIQTAIIFFILLLIAITLQVLYVPKLNFLNIVGTILAFFFVVIGRYLFELLYYKNYYYNQSEDIIYIRKGVIRTTEIAIPFHRIENIFIDQDIFDKILGLYDLHISTVTPVSSTESHIDGLSKENAEKLKSLLIEKINKASKH
jgi:putative membrane protein